MRRVEIGSSGDAGSGDPGDSLPSASTEPAPMKPARSARPSVDRKSEEAALACLDRGKRGEALEILMVAYGARITAFCLRILRDRELAKDVRQLVFLKAFEQLDRFERRGTLWAWLCGIAYHRCLDELKRPANTRNDPLDTMEELIDPSALSESPDRVAKQRALERCLGKLPARARAQVLMRYFFGLSDAEIGELVGDTPGTVQKRVSRSLPLLRQCLCNEGEAR
jgi:RNA polymerase sigma-70 factor (ECF subfamily)